MTPEEMEQEKARLQALVKEFAKEVFKGMTVNIVNIGTGKTSPHRFQMDRYLNEYTLKPAEGATGITCVDVAVRDIVMIYKGGEVFKKFPSLGSIAASCVGVDSRSQSETFLFYLDDAYEREKFYSCMKILRMSVDIQRPT
jgi:hypothetical protein